VDFRDGGKKLATTAEDGRAPAGVVRRDDGQMTETAAN
jgi:hypothetical protein